MLVSLTWRRPLVLVLGVALTYALIATFSPQGAGMLTAYVDHLLGGLAGAAIVLHFSIWPRWRFAWVTVLCVFTLPLIKDAGPSLRHWWRAGAPPGPGRHGHWCGTGCC